MIRYPVPVSHLFHRHFGYSSVTNTIPINTPSPPLSLYKYCFISLLYYRHRHSGNFFYSVHYPILHRGPTPIYLLSTPRKGEGDLWRPSFIITSIWQVRLFLDGALNESRLVGSLFCVHGSWTSLLFDSCRLVIIFPITPTSDSVLLFFFGIPIRSRTPGCRSFQQTLHKRNVTRISDGVT